MTGEDGEDPVELIGRMYAAFNRRDIDGFLAHLASDVRWYTLDPAIQPRFLRGREEVGEFVRSLLATAAVFTAEPQEIQRRGELVLARVCHRSRRRPSDPPTAYPVVHLWTVRDGIVVKHRFYLSASKATKALNGRRSAGSILTAPAGATYGGSKID
jgi:ketosteroid isomerase-like protein